MMNTDFIIGNNWQVKKGRHIGIDIFLLIYTNICIYHISLGFIYHESTLQGYLMNR